ncbi:dihydroorotase [Vulgatibacter incomptus]|uniref:Dihydroorotase n=1 Tax=Vulgatibacter incomptus TaxID=1391653 RepID=A0A0K1PID1_9BACT|nr:dihydroorotase [Vulgatibacter incomptus]AKU93275.1 Dihydroorotase [Vulgatibacter incomptus]
MSTTFDLLLRGGTVVNQNGIGVADVGIRGGRIAAIGDLAQAEAGDELDARGLHVLPGVIDSQVHFREPGLEHKEDLATGTAAAALGGVTAIFEMPNTRPATTTAELLADKISRATGRAFCDFAFYVGAGRDNTEELGELERLPGCAGVKIFMGSSTGDLLVEDDESLARILASGSRRVAVHCEDEERLRERKHLADEAADPRAHPEWRDEQTAFRATDRLLRLARAAGRRVHVLHVTTAEELQILAASRDLATVEVTPQHLTLRAPVCYETLGTLAQMNPPIRSGRHQEALWMALRAGVVDVIGSDHAPHTREEKAKPYPASPSGMPGVQTLLPVMLDHVNEGRLSLERLVDLTSAGPARVFGIAGKGRLAVGYDADLTLVDLQAERTITDSWIASRCGWTPFDGKKVRGWPIATLIRGHVAMLEGQLAEPQGRAVRFAETLPRAR